MFFGAKTELISLNSLPPLTPANLTSHFNLSPLQKERRRSLAGARDDRYVVD
jgi:hypothetical protein